jgi:hypothetical protein
MKDSNVANVCTWISHIPQSLVGFSFPLKKWAEYLWKYSSYKMLRQCWELSSPQEMNFFQWSASLGCVQQYTTSFHISTACENQEWTNLTTSWCKQPLTYIGPSTQPPAEPWSWPRTTTAQFYWSPHTHTRSVAGGWMRCESSIN